MKTTPRIPSPKRLRNIWTVPLGWVSTGRVSSQPQLAFIKHTRIANPTLINSSGSKLLTLRMAFFSIRSLSQTLNAVMSPSTITQDLHQVRQWVTRRQATHYFDFGPQKNCKENNLTFVSLIYLPKYGFNNKKVYDWLKLAKVKKKVHRWDTTQPLEIVQMRVMIQLQSTTALKQFTLLLHCSSILFYCTVAVHSLFKING